MSKKCAWEDMGITDEVGSLEVREFRATGKDCYYFHDFDCLVKWMKANEKTDLIGELDE